MFECPDCGSEHESEAGLKIHYGRSHDGSIAGEPVRCDVCDEQFRKQATHAEKYDRHFCSNECKSEAYKNRVKLECDNCGDDFERRKSHYDECTNQFCSVACRAEYESTRHSVECKNCGQLTEKTGYQYRNADAHYCSTECRNEHQQGDNHPSWISGSWLLKTLRRHVGEFRWRNRFDHLDMASPLKCEACGATEDEVNQSALDTHHIVPVMAGGSNHPENLMTLCRPCHRSVDSFMKDQLEYPLAETFPTAK